jgi:autotransporter-associated beta strand protein
MLLCGKAAAQTALWVPDGDDSNWLTPANWSPATVPSTLSDVQIYANSESITVTSTVNSAFTINSLTIEGGPNNVNLTGGGSLAITTSLTDGSSNPVTISAQILSAAGVVSNQGGTLTLSGNNSYTGTTSITDDGTLILGSATALGTGSLMLGSGSSLFATTSSTFTVGNAINLSGEGSVYLMGGMGSTLTLTGMITGSNYTTLVIDPPGCGGTNYLALTSGCSTFNGGVAVRGGNTTLAVGASSTGTGSGVTQGPLGTGTLYLGNGVNLTATTTSPITIGNNIALNYQNVDTSDVGIFNSATSTGGGYDLTLSGMITGSSKLTVYASFNGCANTLTLSSGCSTFTGGVSVQGGNADLVVGASSTGDPGSVSQGPLGTGTLMLSDGNVFTTTGTSCFTINNDISLCGDGTVTILDEGMGKMLTLGGMITGSSTLEIAAPTCGGPNSLYLTSGCSTFSGGVRVDSGYTGLFVGASSSSNEDGSVTQGPLGTGTLMLGSGSDFETNGDGCITIGNNISLCGSGPVYIEAAYGGNMLTLSGMISGYANVEVGLDATNSLTLTSGCSTFCGGVTVEDGCTTLVVGANGVGSAGDITSGPLGTGTLELGNHTTLTTPSETCITVLNPIELGTEESDGCVTVHVGGNSSTLTLLGNISDYYGPGSLVIDGPTDLEGQNSYSGGTTVSCNTTLTVGTDNGLGTGPLTANSGSTVTLTSCAPLLNSPTLNGATLTFTNGSGNPLLNGLTMMCGATVNFAAGSTPVIENMNSDSSSSDEINLGSGTQLKFLEGSDPAFYGSIGGNGSIEFANAGGGAEFDLEGSNTYSGGTTVDSGILLVADNSQALGNGGMLTLKSGSAFGVGSGVTITNPISIPSDHVAIGGYGTISTGQTITIQALSGITGGTGTVRTADVTHPVIGTLSFGPGTPVVFGPSGGLQLSIEDASGAAGVGYSTIDVAGNLSITAGPGANTFNIQLVGVDSTGQRIGVASNFSLSQSYSWTLVSAGSISGFSSTDFFIDSTSFFSNPTAPGAFSVAQSGNNLVLNFTPVPEPSTWALMACGVCMLAGAAVRRRRRA